MTSTERLQQKITELEGDLLEARAEKNTPTFTRRIIYIVATAKCTSATETISG